MIVVVSVLVVSFPALGKHGTKATFVEKEISGELAFAKGLLAKRAMGVGV